MEVRVHCLHDLIVDPLMKLQRGHALEYIGRFPLLVIARVDGMLPKQVLVNLVEPQRWDLACKERERNDRVCVSVDGRAQDSPGCFVRANLTSARKASIEVFISVPSFSSQRSNLI